MTQVMLADAALASEQRERVEVMHGAGMTMRALVDDLLDVAKIEHGQLTLENAPFDLARTIRDASRLFDGQADAKGIGFTIDLDDCPAMVMGDAARIRQIVFNLLSNALKFTSVGRVSWSPAASPRACRSLSPTAASAFPATSWRKYSRPSARLMPAPRASSAAPAWALPFVGGWRVRWAAM